LARNGETKAHISYSGKSERKRGGKGRKKKKMGKNGHKRERGNLEILDHKEERPSEGVQLGLKEKDRTDKIRGKIRGDERQEKCFQLQREMVTGKPWE